MGRVEGPSGSGRFVGFLWQEFTASAHALLANWFANNFGAMVGDGVDWYLQGSRPKPGFLRWGEVDSSTQVQELRE